jgi:hypothetical protein
VKRSGAAWLGFVAVIAVGGVPAAEEPQEVALRALELVDRDRWRDAAALIETLEPGDDDAPEVVAARAETLYRAGHIAESGRVLGAASPDVLPPRARSLAGLVAKAEGRHAEAADWMQRAVSSDPTESIVWFRAAEATDSRSEAVRRLERYLELAPETDADRIRAARGTIEVLRALGERAVWTPVERPEAVRVPLQLVLEARGDPVAALVRVRLAGRSAALLLDTGSSGLFVEDALARRGFAPLAEETTFGGGGNERHSSRRGTFAEFRLGDLVLGQALASTAPGRLDAGGRYRGVLGLAPLGGYRVTLDLARGALELGPEGEPAADSVPYWVVNGQMLVEAEVGSTRGLFLFDTGAETSVVDLETARSLPGARIGEEAGVRGYGGAIPGARRVDGVAVRFGALETRGPLHAVDLALRSRLGGVEISGYLGMDVLGGSRVVVDTRAQRVEVSRERRRRP